MENKTYRRPRGNAALLLVLCLVPAAAGLAQDQPPTGIGDLLEVDPGSVPRAVLQEGEGRFVDECSSCHGRDADGLGPWNGSFLPLPANLTQVRDTPEMLFSIVLNGVPGTPMPPHPRLSRQTFRAIWLWVRSRPASRAYQWGMPEKLDARPIETSAGIGAGHYVTACLGCHGPGGGGDGEYARSPYVWPKPADLRARSSSEGRLYSIVSEGINGTMMPLQKNKIPDYARLALARYAATLFQPASTSTIRVPDAEIPRRANPFTASDRQAVQAGGDTVNLYCTYCHGGNASGGFQAPDLTDDRWIFGGGTDNAVFTVIELGVPGKLMPGWTALEERTRWQVIAWLRSRGGLPDPIIAQSGGGQSPSSR